ncbi:MAG: hypothetical protein HY047_11340 [Acidobacteria bacterium]|nr:hypothetical protein [Acidobacteriota bacterium]
MSPSNARSLAQWPGDVKGAKGKGLRQERAFYNLLDDLTARTTAGAQDRPTFAYFVMKVQDIFPTLRHDREFINLIVDTLRMERPAYRELSKYAQANGWPTWT